MSQTFYWQSKKTTTRKAVQRQKILDGVDELVGSVFPLGFVPEDNRKAWWTEINVTEYDNLREELGLRGEEDLSLMLPPMNDFESDVLKKLRGDMSRLNEDGCCYPYSSKNMTSIKSLLKAYLSVAQEITDLDTEKTDSQRDKGEKDVRKEGADETTKERLIREINVLVKILARNEEQLKNKKNTKNKIVSSLKNIFTSEPSWIVDKRKKGKLITPFHRTLQKSIERSTAHLQRTVTDLHPSVQNTELFIPRSIATNYPLGIVAQQPAQNVIDARDAVKRAEREETVRHTELTDAETRYRKLNSELGDLYQKAEGLTTDIIKRLTAVELLSNNIQEMEQDIPQMEQQLVNDRLASDLLVKRIEELKKELDVLKRTSIMLDPNVRAKTISIEEKLTKAGHDLTKKSDKIKTLNEHMVEQKIELVDRRNSRDALNTALFNLKQDRLFYDNESAKAKALVDAKAADIDGAKKDLSDARTASDNAKIDLAIIDSVVIDANWNVFDMFNHRDDIQSVKMLKNVHGVKLKASVIIGFSANGQIKQHESCPWYHDGFAGTVWEYKIPTHSRMMLKDCEWRAALDDNDVPLMDINLPRGFNEYAVRLSFLGSDGKISPLSNIITGRDVHRNMKKVIARKNWPFFILPADVARLDAKVTEVLTQRQPAQRFGFLKRVMWLEQQGLLRNGSGGLTVYACLHLEPTLKKQSLENEALALLQGCSLRVSNMPNGGLSDVSGGMVVAGGGAVVPVVPPAAAPVVPLAAAAPVVPLAAVVPVVPLAAAAPVVPPAAKPVVQEALVVPLVASDTDDSEDEYLKSGSASSRIPQQPTASFVAEPSIVVDQQIAKIVEDVPAISITDISDTDSAGGADWKTTWAMDESVSELSGSDTGKLGSSSGHGMWASTSSGNESSVVKSEVWASSTTSGTDQLPAVWASSTSSGGAVDERSETASTPSDTDELVSSDGDSSKHGLEDALWAASASGTESDKASASLSGTEESSGGIWATTTDSSAEDEDNLNNITALVNTVPVYAPWASGTESNMWASDDDDDE